MFPVACPLTQPTFPKRNPFQRTLLCRRDFGVKTCRFGLGSRRRWFCYFSRVLSHLDNTSGRGLPWKRLLMLFGFLFGMVFCSLWEKDKLRSKQDIHLPWVLWGLRNLTELSRSLKTDRKGGARLTKNTWAGNPLLKDSYWNLTDTSLTYKPYKAIAGEKEKKTFFYPLKFCTQGVWIKLRKGRFTGDRLYFGCMWDRTKKK